MSHTPSELTVLAGVWLTAGPLLFDHHAATAVYAGWSEVIAGLSLVALGYGRAVHKAGTLRLIPITAVVGAWVMLSPFAGGYADAATAMWNDLITGAAVIAFSAASWWTSRAQRDSERWIREIEKARARRSQRGYR
ncbi:SPW repeat protein [Actinoplanes sp. HUAS TT8]|uniref:SPW repeat protein n=1 Tax=Actinoplanes sp. HUAS TT8 TaxID=3447453 RepID=UPI003F51E4DA